MADRAAGLAAHELERIGILLLRHHAAAGAERVGQLEEAVLVAAEDDQILGQPAEVHHRHRARVEERRREVAIRRRVDAVGDDAREAEIARERVDVDRVAVPAIAPEPSGSASASSRAPCEALVVAPQRRGVREEEMRDEHRLRRPEVRERRHQRVAGRRRPAPRAPRRTRATAALQQRNAPAQIEPQVERHLLVARPAGVQPAAGVAEALDQQPLDEAVHVLVGAVDERRVGSPALEDIGERRRRSAGASSAASTPAAASARAHARLPVDVVFEQPAIETERRAEFERRRVGRGVEAAGPQS